MNLMKELEALARDDPSVGKAMGSILKKHDPKIFEPRPPQRRDITPSDGEAKVKFIIASIPDDFKELCPGTEMWMRYWKANPGKQEEILRWQKEMGFNTRRSEL